MSSDSETIKDFQWIVVPHGKDASGQMRATIRVSPTVLGDGSDTTLAKLREDGRRGMAPIMDWPKFASQSIDTVRVGIYGDPNGPAIVTVPYDFRAALLKRRGEIADDGLPSQIWAALIQEPITVTTRRPACPPIAGARRNAVQDVKWKSLKRASRDAQLVMQALQAYGEGYLKGIIRGASLAGAVNSTVAAGSAVAALHGISATSAGPSEPPGFPTDSWGARRFSRERWKAFGLSHSVNKIFQDLEKGELPGTGLANHLLHRLYSRAPDPPELSGCTDTQTASPPEIHQRWGSVTGQPWLLDLLGLTLEIVIPINDDVRKNAAAFGGQLLFRVDSWSRPGNELPISLGDQPLVVVTCDAPGADKSLNDLFAADYTKLLASLHGCVNLSVMGGDGTNRFVLSQGDPDHLSEKLLVATASQGSQFDAAVPTEQQRAALGALQTTGLALYDKNVDDEHTQATERSATCPQKLYRQDLRIGYKPDVCALEVNEDGTICTQPWKTLVGRRLRSFELNGRNVMDRFKNAIEDEGYVAAMVTRRDPNAQDDPARIPFQEVFRWSNWNLCVPHVECSDADPGDSTEPVRCFYGPANGLAMQRTRWGYRVGLREMYVDGRSIELTEASSVYELGTCEAPQYCRSDNSLAGYTSLPDCEKTVSPALGDEDGAYQQFLRYEPVGPPDVHLAEPLKRDVLRSVGMKRVFVASRKAGEVVVGGAKRVFVPPRGTLELAIRDGMYDSSGMRGSPPKSAFPGVVLNRETGAVPKGDNDETIFKRSSFASPPDVPYLPDPWARRLIIGIFRQADDALVELHYHDYYNASQVWPDAAPMTLEVRAAHEGEVSQRNGGFQALWTGTNLTLALAPGTRLTLRAWHEVDEKMMAASGAVDAMANYLATPEGAAACASALKLGDCCGETVRESKDALIRCLSGWGERFPENLSSYLASGKASRRVILPTFWMLNPIVQVEIAHAVLQPCGELAFSNAENPAVPPKASARAPSNRSDVEQHFECRRVSGTDAVFVGDIRFDRATTAQIDCLAQWEDIDDSRSAGKRAVRRPFKDHVFTLRQLPGVLSNPAHSGRAIELAEDNDLLLLNGNRLASFRLTNEDLLAQASAGQSSSVVYKGWDWRARLVTFEATATSRFSSDFTDAKKGTDTRRSAPASRWVCATRMPDPPVVSHVVPLFEWDHRLANQEVRHRRKGGFFRIWLERPWFSSGDEELLALVCEPQDLFKARSKGGLYDRLRANRAWGGFAQPVDQPGPADPLFRVVTGWGGDPIWSESTSAALQALPPSVFLNRMKDVEVRVDLANRSDPALNGIRVALALYQPLYDEEEQRWYVDMHMDDGGAYLPFVRLGLARYQPHAVTGAELSEIVSSEFVQLIPNRLASVSHIRQADGMLRVDVTVHGAAPLGMSATAWRGEKSRMRMRIDEQDSGFALPSKTTTAGYGVPSYLDLVGGGAWRPVSRAPTEFEEFERYDDSSLWRACIAFDLKNDRRYSVYLEELQPQIRDVDPKSPEDVEFKSNPDGRRSWAVVYSDRLLIQYPAT